MSKITEKIRYVGVNDHETTLFEGLWPLPYGVSYNSYLIIEKENALIDTVDARFKDKFIENIRKHVGASPINYLIINHMEPDHSSSVSAVMELWPDITILASSRAVPMLTGYYGISAEKIRTVGDGDSLSLGETVLSFHMTPMVHWPETMMTWDESEKTLFSGDAFGTFGIPGTGITDSNLEDLGPYRDEMIRYYSNIVGKYGNTVQAAMKKLSALEIKRICSTHGPVWEKLAADVAGLYGKLSRYEAEPGVCIAYGSMYGNTAEAALCLSKELTEAGVPNAIHPLCTENISDALRDVFKYNTIAIGSPTYNGGIFPPAETFMKAISARNVKGRKFVAFGSYSWAAASVKLLAEQAQSLGFELIGLPEETPGSQNGGISFPHAYSPEKCDMKALAEIIRKSAGLA